MALPPAAPREPVHRRAVDCRGYRREDGLWDIEAHLVDTKSYGFPNRHRGTVRAGEPIHDMWLRVTVDTEFLIHDAEAATDASPFAPCPEVAPRFHRLRGLQIGPGWRRQVRQRLGGVEGCTHLVELLDVIATTAVQTLVKARGEEDPEPGGGRPRFLDSCHALACNGPVVREHWPEHYTGDDGTTD